MMCERGKKVISLPRIHTRFFGNSSIIFNRSEVLPMHSYHSVAHQQQKQGEADLIAKAAATFHKSFFYYG